MNKILTLVAMALFILLSSCGKDDKTNEVKNPLIGEWALLKKVEAGRVLDANRCKEYDYLYFSEKHIENHIFDMDMYDYSCKERNT